MSFCFSSVVAMDIDEKKIKLARNNAGIYGGIDNIDFRANDFFCRQSVPVKADVVVTSPPWGGPKYLSQEVYSLSVMCEDNGGGEAIIRISKSMAPRLALHLPRTVDKSEVCIYIILLVFTISVTILFCFQCVAIAKKLYFNKIKFEDNFINDRLNSTTVYLG